MATPAPGTQPQVPGSPDPEKQDARRRWQRFWLRSRGDQHPTSPTRACPVEPPVQSPAEPPTDQQPRPGFKRMARKVVPGLPRPATFRRQISEQRDRLELAVPPSVPERRTLSVGSRPRKARGASPPPAHPAKLSAPTFSTAEEPEEAAPSEAAQAAPSLQQPQAQHAHSEHTPVETSDGLPDAERDEPPQELLQAQLAPYPVARPALPPTPPDDHPPGPDPDPLEDMDDRWILNLSMHFRDKSPREKFFVTYAQEANKWRRVTVSCDYREAPRDSLEKDLEALTYQRDKSERIYEALAASLPSIQFYDTVTNLRLQTSEDDRLHVHVTEDVNEVIQFPSVDAISHLEDLLLVAEHEVHFVSHMSGFVYKVRVDAGSIGTCVKKEIPGPDSVEEFLYEINALHALRAQPHVIRLVGLVIDDARARVTGLLIDYAARGPLVDILYDRRDDPAALAWAQRARWAWQIVAGLAAIHEAGFVQGDFTLSNIVVDGRDDAARIIDINRRGCPVGWEPPEFRGPLHSGQRIALYIGAKSDLFQLGMVLWALAMREDEPERHPQELSLAGQPGVPRWFQDLAHTCLSADPARRVAAKDLLARFPARFDEVPAAEVAEEEAPVPGRPEPSQGVPPELRFFGACHEERRPSTSRSRSPARDELHIPAPEPGPAGVEERPRGRALSRDVDPPASPVSPPVPLSIQSPRSEHVAEGSEGAAAGPNDGQGTPQIVGVSPGDEPAWMQLRDDGEGILVSRDLMEEIGEPERGRAVGGHTERADLTAAIDNGVEAIAQVVEPDHSRADRTATKGGMERNEQYVETNTNGADRVAMNVGTEMNGQDVETDTNGAEHVVRRKEGSERLSSEISPRAFNHVDSGIADMDVPGSAKDDGRRYERSRLEKMVEESSGSSNGAGGVANGDGKHVNDLATQDQRAATTLQ